MAIIACAECERAFSSLAPSCPNCGAPTSASMPQESLRIDELESGSLRVNRNKAEAKVVVRAASERLGLEFTSRHGDDGIVVNGTLFRHNASKLYFTFDEEPGGRATVLAPHLASGWTLGAGKLQRELVESMKSVGTNHG